jgi:putative addiction module killer protein
MLEVRQTEEFEEWLDRLADAKGKEKIAQGIARVQSGLFGDAKYFDGIGELRIDFGPGYRVYFVKRGRTLVLLIGGNKKSQRRDIKKAVGLAKEV